jgi:hypothetical protein
MSERPRSRNTDGESSTSFPTPARVPATLLARRLDWAALLARVFAIDVLRCSECGGRRRVLAFLTDPAVVAKVLVHLGLPTHPPPVTSVALSQDPSGGNLGFVGLAGRGAVKLSGLFR